MLIDWTGWKKILMAGTVPTKGSEKALRKAGRAIVEAEVSTGTYVRVLADDAARACGTRAHLRELRRLVYTTNTIESLNYQLRKVTKNRGHFPNDDAVVKLLWLAICNIEDKRARDRERDRGKPASERKAQGRLVEGQVVTNWKQALAQLAIAYPDRINPHL